MKRDLNFNKRSRYRNELRKQKIPTLQEIAKRRLPVRIIAYLSGRLPKENWIEFTQEYGTWEQIIENRDFLNETEEGITIHSMDTSKDPQYYPLYKPKDGILMYVAQEEPPVKRFVVCKSKRKNHFPMWAKIVRVIISPSYLIPKKSIRRKQVCYTLNFTERFAMEFRVSKRP